MKMSTIIEDELATLWYTPRKTKWDIMRKLIFSILILCCLSIPTQAKQTSQKHFRFGAVEESSFIAEFHNKILVEAFRRNGLTCEIVIVPDLQTLSKMVDAGELDGDTRRVKNFAKNGDHPGYVRINESVLSLEIRPYSLSEYSIESWGDLEPLELTVGCIKGSELVEHSLERHAPDTPVWRFDSRLEAMQALRDGGVQMVIVANQYLAREILQLKEFKNSEIHELPTLRKIDIYSYFFRKHAALAPVIAKTLRQMKKDGTIQKFLLEVMTK